MQPERPMATSHRSATPDDLGRLHDAPLLPDFIVQSLETCESRPCIEFRGHVATYADVRDQTSQMVQVLRAHHLGVGRGIAVLSKNRPEVITNMTASAVNGCVATPLHPMGSLDDHAFTIGAAGSSASFSTPTPSPNELVSSQTDTPICSCSGSVPTT